MLYKYTELLKNTKFNNAKKIKKAINDKKLFKYDNGLYSENNYVSELELVSQKYKNAVFTSDSAFFYHGLTDNIPNKYYLATKKKARKIQNTRISQVFMEDKYLNIGITEIDYNNTKIKVYDLERMLIELVRHKNVIPYDMYKEIINNYRKIVDKLNLLKLQNYLSKFKYKYKYLKMIQDEVL